MSATKLMHIRMIIALSFVVFVSACSSSSAPQSSAVAEPSTDANTDSVNDTAEPLAEGEVADNSIIDNTDEIDEGVSGVTDNESLNTNEVESENPVSEVTNPVAQNRTQLNLDITVPAYQSDALQLRVTWGDMDLTAKWIADELWTAESQLFINTEHMLTITFYDNNGDLELGTYNRLYLTGTNSYELLTIGSEQFDTEKWDKDKDSVSNLNELIAGTDPLIYENINLEVRDSVVVDNTVFLLETFSRRIPAQRPYNEQFEVSELPEDCEDHCSYLYRNIQNIDINVDAAGNGSLSDFHERGSSSSPRNVNQEAIRSVSTDSINWEGFWRFHSEYRDGWTESIRFTSAVAAIDESTRSYIGAASRSGGADYTQGSASSSYTLSGRAIEGSALCEPTAGSIVTDIRYQSEHVKVTTISKNQDDAYWKVSVVHTEDSTKDEDYFARLLSMGIWQDENWGSVDYPSFTSGNEAKFHCDLADL